VAAEHPKQADLKLVSVPKDRKPEVVALLATLTGHSDYDFAGALQSPPWTLMRKTELAILQEWKQVLDAAGTKVIIEESSAISPNRKKTAAPIFDSDAPPPGFLPPAITAGIRSVGASLSNASIRLKWVEAVTKAFAILESFYKSDPSGRILFSDFLLQIEQQFHEAVSKFHSRYKKHQEGFAETILKLRNSLEKMESEIQAVRSHVEQQL
jgi:hypothetical protein